ncbi:MAG: Rpn family recombination-promoting nuclease/putative transposase [Gallionella sp.]|nr:Rpn family recombination-promoting nuclease/putative transposase [Gallionella sp.]
MRFLDVKTDYAFKRVFGSEGSKPVLISFLNAILDYQGEHAIVELTIVDPYQIPMLQGMKDTYVDVKAVLANGKHVIIEMQVLNVPGFEKRILHNAAKEYATQLLKGEDYALLNPVIALTFADFNLFEDSEECISRFKLMERDRFIEYSDDVELIFVELPKFKRALDELSSIQDKWIYFLKNAGSLEYIPDTLACDPRINEAFSLINEAAMSREELEIQFKRRDFIILQRGSLQLAETQGLAKGYAKGIALGIEQGIEQGIETVARKLLDILDDATIAGKTGLSVEQVRLLRLS